MIPSLLNIRHERSKKDFPFLALEEGEYVELAISRSKLGLVLVWGAEIVGFLFLAILAIFALNVLSRSASLSAQAYDAFWLLTLVLGAVLILTGALGTIIYNSNHLYITNKRLFQYTMSNMLSRSVNIIELARIEDVSFHQAGIFDHIFSIGTIRLSTVGDETTYTFPFIDTPKDELDFIARLVMNAKRK